MPYSSSIGFTVVQNTACLPLLKFFPPGINPFLIIEFTSLAFPTWWMYSVYPFCRQCVVRERLHVTVFGKNASLSLERASNCTNIQYFDGVSNFSCMERFLVLLDRLEFLPILFSSSIGFTVVKKTACLLELVHFVLLSLEDGAVDMTVLNETA